MKFFALGLGIGSLVGSGLAFLQNPQTGHQVKKDVNDWVKGTAKDTVYLANSVQNGTKAAVNLKTQIPAVNKTVSDLLRDLDDFKIMIKPDLEIINEDIKKINSTLENLK